MIGVENFTKELIRNNLGPFIEVPCSYFKDLLNYLFDTSAIDVINPVNEAIAMGMASGHFLGSGKIPIVAMQNSGLMNTLNAITSLNQIYDIPVFYLVSWRGSRDKVHDAPEHKVVGKNLERILKTFEIPYEIIDNKRFSSQIKKLAERVKQTQKPVALIIKKNTFTHYSKTDVKNKNIYLLTRLEVISTMKEELVDKALFISTTGYPSRDSFTAKDTPDLYIVGSMGHAFSIALGVAPYTKKKVVVFDGDGSSLMHVGGLASFNPIKHKNIVYTILDNEMYESTGGQPTVSRNVNFVSLAKAFGFKKIYSVKDIHALRNIIKKISKNNNQPCFIHVKIGRSLGEESKRVSDFYTCPQIKNLFMKEVQKNKV